MAIVQEFNYFKPGNLKKAVKLLAEQKKPVILAGGTDLVSELKSRAISPGTLIDIKGIPRLGGITFNNKTLKIGALVTFSDLLKSEIIREHFPLLQEMAGAVASVAVRNRATLAGNLCSAVPCMDSGPVLRVYDAEVNVTGLGCNFKFPISQWFKGNRKTALKGAGIVTSVSLALPSKPHAGCFLKLGRYRGEDLAQANVAVLVLANQHYRVGFGSVAAVPVRAKQIENALKGQPLTDDLLNLAKELIPQEIDPITDVRASKEYRLHMCGVMFERAVKTAANRLQGRGPAYGNARV